MSQKYVNQCLGDAQRVVRTVYLAHVLYGLSRPIRKKMWFVTPTLGEWGGVNDEWKMMGGECFGF